MSQLLGDPKDWDWKEIRYRAKGAAAVLVCFAILIGAALFGYTKAMHAWHEFRIRDDYIGTGTEDVTVVVPRGANTYQISDILVAADVVRTAKAFDTAALNNADSAKIQPGHYKLRKQLPAKTALAMMLDPKNRVFKRVTVIEGRTLQELLAQLAQPKEKGGTGNSLDEYNKALADTGQLGLPDYAQGNAEGFMFPDTYEFGEDGTALEVLQQMSQRYGQVAQEINLVAATKNLDQSLGMTPLQVVTVASIIEREVHRDEDRPKVARVLYNRLKGGIPLQLDSTVHYAVNKPGNEQLTDADFASKSPYNTYRVLGLPPGPISSPGRAALLAALSPADGDWMYFTTVNLDTGETRFEYTQEEHDANVAEFQAWCSKNPGKC